MDLALFLLLGHVLSIADVLVGRGFVGILLLKDRLRKLHGIGCRLTHALWLTCLGLTPAVGVTQTFDLFHFLFHVLPGHRYIFIGFVIVNNFLLTRDIHLGLVFPVESWV